MARSDRLIKQIMDLTFQKLIRNNNFQRRESDMKVALQYCPTQGLGPLIQWLKSLQRMVHAPPAWENGNEAHFDVVVTSGSQDGLCKVFNSSLPNMGPCRKDFKSQWMYLINGWTDEKSTFHV